MSDTPDVTALRDALVDEPGIRQGGQAMSTIEDQPPPQPATGDMWLLVIEDMKERRQVGIDRYGTPLQAYNGRNSLVDLYQELMDAVVYVRTEIEEKDLAWKIGPDHTWDCEGSHEVFDDDGYPTEEYLEHLSRMHHELVFADPWRFVDYIKQGWSYPDYIWERGRVLRMSTGGWSGNETMISALEHNFIFWMFWSRHRAGGHYTFDMKKPRGG